MAKVYKVDNNQKPLDSFDDLLKYYAKTKKAVEMAQEREQEARRVLLEGMKKADLATYDNLKNVGKVSYTSAGTRNTFSSSEFKKDNPDLYKQYVRESPVKERIVITLAKK